MNPRQTKIDEDGFSPAPNPDRQGVPMALRAAESGEDVRLPAPNRDCQGVYMALRAAETDEDALSDERGINNLGRVFNGADVFTVVFNRGDTSSERTVFNRVNQDARRRELQ
jgi:hypothetical protein